MEEYRRLCRWEDNIKMDLKETVNIPISSQLCYVTMETIWMNTVGFVDGRTILRWILKKQLISPLVVSYAMLLWRRYGRIQEAL